MKFVNNTTLRITSSGKRFEHPKEFPSEQDYVKIFTLENQLQKQRKIFVCCQIESSIRMGEFKYGDESVMHYLIELHTFMKKKKFSTHQEDNIELFKFINLVFPSQRTTRKYTRNVLLNVYLSEDEIKTLQMKDKNKNGQYEVRISAFYIHHKLIGNEHGSKRITTSSYEIRCHPKDSKILKTLLENCSEDLEKKFDFVPFDRSQMSSNTKYCCHSSNLHAWNNKRSNGREIIRQTYKSFRSLRYRN